MTLLLSVLTFYSICVCGVLRIVSTVPIYYETYDMTWFAYEGWIWFAVECHLAVICASAPALKIIVKRTLGGSNWNSLQRNSTGAWNGYSGNSNPIDLTIGRSEKSKVKTLTTMASSDYLRDSEEGESVGIPIHDVELGYMDPEENHVKDTRRF
jgi:hypothetical protein